MDAGAEPKTPGPRGMVQDGGFAFSRAAAAPRIGDLRIVQRSCRRQPRRASGDADRAANCGCAKRLRGPRPKHRQFVSDLCRRLAAGHEIMHEKDSC